MEFSTALEQAASDMREADRNARRMAQLLVGRLRLVDSSYYLKKLKAELSQFDARTGRWST